MSVRLLGVELDADHQPRAADLGEHLVLTADLAQFPTADAHRGRVLDELFFLSTVERGQSGGHGQVVLGKGRRMDEAAVEPRENLFVDPPFAQHGGHGDVAAGEGLGDDQDVGLDAPVLAGEHLARAAQARLHFVGNEEGPVFAAELDRLGQVIVADGTKTPSP